MNKQEAIEKLTVKRDDALHFKKLYKPGDVGWSANESKAIAFNMAINTMRKIDEPLDALAQEYDVERGVIRKWLDRGHKGSFEKAGVSQEFADWVENAMIYQVMTKEWCLKEIANMGWGDWLHDPQNGEKYPSDNHWSCEVYRNKEKHIKAIYDGYTVKPKRWVVKRSDGDYVNDYQEATLCVGIGLTPELDVLPPFKFTDKSKAEAVAVLVEGSVEEV